MKKKKENVALCSSVYPINVFCVCGGLQEKEGRTDRRKEGKRRGYLLTKNFISGFTTILWRGKFSRTNRSSRTSQTMSWKIFVIFDCKSFKFVVWLVGVFSEIFLAYAFMLLARETFENVWAKKDKWMSQFIYQSRDSKLQEEPNIFLYKTGESETLCLGTNNMSQLSPKSITKMFFL